MEMRGSTSTARAREMRQVLRRLGRSGLTQRAFAEREGMSAGTLAWWGHVFRRADAASQGSRRRTTSPPSFVEVKLSAEPSVVETPLEVVVRGGQVIRVPAAFNAATLRALVAALESTC